ncbi:MAG: hypothetical protein HY925_12055 [Elusimicrobia bacterium]|nr:hypothetical protein [Elusimicrobiota bacterium]
MTLPGEPASKSDLKSISLIVLAIIFGMFAGAGLIRVFLKPPASNDAALKPGTVDVAFSPKPQLATADPTAADGTAPPEAGAARLPVLPLPPKIPARTRPRVETPAAEVEAEAPPEIEPANFYNYGLEQDASRSGAQQDVSPGGAPARPKLKRMGGVGQIRAHGRLERRAFTSPNGAPKTTTTQAPSSQPDLTGGAIKTLLSRTFGMPDGSMTVPLSSFRTSETGVDATTGGGETNTRGSTTGGIDTRLHAPVDPTLTEQAAQSPAIEPRQATFDLRAPAGLQFRVTNIPKERTVVCYEVLAHPCCPGCVGPGNLCDDSANYASFRGNSEWSYQGGAWIGRFPWDPAVWACDGIRVRMVFADKKTGAHAGAGLDVINGR